MGTSLHVGGGGGGGEGIAWADPAVPNETPGDIEWGGSDAAAMDEVTISGSHTIIESNGLLSVKFTGQTSEDLNGLVAAKTFSIGDAWAVPVRTLMVRDTTTSKAGIILADGITATDNVVFGEILQSNTELLAGRHGTWTDSSTVPWVSDLVKQFGYPWLWMRLTYVSANVFRFEVSPDGLSWTAFKEADIAKTMVPTHVGVAWATIETHDQIATFGPLRKVA